MEVCGKVWWGVWWRSVVGGVVEGRSGGGVSSPHPCRGGCV